MHVTVFPGTAPQEVSLGAAGATVVNGGPGTVYYAATQGVSATSNDGSLASGGSATLYGTQFLFVARGDSRADVEVALAAAGSAGSGSLIKLEVHGHSWPGGTGIANTANRYPERVSAALRATTFANRAVGGAFAAKHGLAQGGHSSVMQNITRSRQAAPYLPGSHVVVLDYGLNDTGNGVPLVSFTHAMRAMITRARAAAIYEETHASVTLAGATWVTSTSTDYSGGTNKNTATPATATITIAVPADFPGGTVALGFLLGDDTQTYRTDGVYAASVDGGAPVTMDTRGLGLPVTFVNACCMRLPGLAAGAHSIVVTFPTPPPGDVFFDYWSIEAASPPLVLLPTEPLLTQAAYNVYPAGSRPTDASVGLLNAALASLAAEFTDGMVQTVDLSALNKSATLIQAADPLHPNEWGHAVIAQIITAKIAAALPSTLGYLVTA